MRKIEDVILKDGRSLKEILELHKKWLKEEKDGEKADLSYEDLSDVDFSDLNLRCAILRGANLRGTKLSGTKLTYANLRGANLRDTKLTGAYLGYADLTGVNLRSANLTYADLIGTILSGADLTSAKLSYADLRVANLRGTDLTGANLKDANLRDVDLKGANLTRANLTGANLKDVKYNNTTAFFELQCPEEGSFIGYKKADNKIVKLLITEDAKRSSATTRKCRCSKAKVLSITSIDGKKNFEKVTSDYDLNFIYEVGKIVEVKDFDENRWNECSNGIHFFITRDEAVMY